MEKYYLQKKYNDFVDPHGEIDPGGCEKSIIYTNELLDLDLSLEYDEEYQVVDQENWSGSEDCYNAEYITYIWKELSGKEEADRLQAVITEYESL